MPATNTVKPFKQNSVYHIYNRGIEKRAVFLDSQDYYAFLNILRKYLLPGMQQDNEYHVDLLSYCLMPNHFHLLIKQYDDVQSITKFMKRLIISYVIYFNRRYDRRGTLFETIYKGSLVQQDIYLLHLSRYIHLNPAKLSIDPYKYHYSSLRNYLGKSKSDWIKTDLLLEYFDKAGETDFTFYKSYESFLKY